MVTFPVISGKTLSAACIAMAVLLFLLGEMMAGRNPFTGVLFILLSLLLLFGGLSFMGRKP